jgi:large conductance mechanosensitive channel
MLKGFKDFLMRGNVVDLAVGIAIGVAFTALVGAFGTAIINPLIAAVGGGGADSRGLGFSLTDSSATYINIGLLINAFIVFLVTMAVIYYAVVVPVMKMQAMRKTPQEETVEAVAEEIALLREIRDSLKK